ncbi:MAG: hypothetical protein ABII88_05795 [Candidatus Omnitrophota bacterium]
MKKSRLCFICILLITVILMFSCDAHAAFRLGENGPKVSAFVENDFGIKLGNDTTKRDEFNMFEQRLQLKTSVYPEYTELLEDWMAQVNVKADFTVDEYFNGRTDAQMRELNLAIAPLDWMDTKIGRQVFTWGTGDYLFVNDLFPKDYVSFYIGRDDEYLKKPSDGAKVSLYSEKANLDLVVIPFFEPNTIFNGQRLSFFDPFQGGIAGVNSNRTLTEPDQNPDNIEYAARVYKSFDSYETAFYLFRGYYKMPRGYLNEFNRELFYPRLDAYGASIRGPVFGGVGYAEGAYYNSPQDNMGDNRLIENPMFKYMLGFEKDLGNDLKAGMQYLYEQILEYTNYRNTLLGRDYYWDEYRHLTTLRVTKLYKNQTVMAGLFVFFSPSDLDGYVRPSITYDVSDVLKITLGANLVWGEDVQTEFGQMEHNKNIYTRVKYSF